MTDPFAKAPRILARLPRLVRLYILHSLIGFALSGLLTWLVIHYDFANIGHLVTTVKGGWLAAFVFFMLNGTVFAGVQTGIAIMSMARDEGDDSGRRPPLERAGLPIPVRVDRRP